jgi:ketosteroid isomerase-like protein
MDPNDAKTAVLSFLDAMGDRDIEALRRKLTATAHWWGPPSSIGHFDRPLVGAERVADLAGGKTLGSFRPGTTSWHVMHMTAEGDFVAGLMTRRAVGANGRPYEAQYHWLFRFEDDLIAEVWEVIDTAQARAQLAP